MKQLALRYGLLMFAGFTVFFLMMHLVGLSDRPLLRLFNGVIHAGLLWQVLRVWTRSHHGNASDYVEGVVLGMFTSVVAVVPFTVFMAIFLAYNPALLARIQAHTPIGELFTPVAASLFILVEGVAVGLIVSYIIVRVLDVLRQRAS